MEACFTDDARIADYETLLSPKNSTPIGDTGTFALYSGYNAIRVKQSDEEEYLIALDRSCLVFCDTRTDSEDSGYHDIDGAELGKTFNEFVMFGRNTDQDTLDAPTKATGKGVDVLVVRNGEILVGLRRTEGTFCGPGGHIEEGETPKEAAIRETLEEFGITPVELIHIGSTSGTAELYLPSEVYLCTEYDGVPKADGNEMQFAQFMEPAQVSALIDAGAAFPPFAESIKLLLQSLPQESTSSTIKVTTPTNTDGGPGSGNFGHKGVPGQVGGSAPSGGASTSKGTEPSGGTGQRHASKATQKQRTAIRKQLIGVKVPEHGAVGGVSGHACDRMVERKISLETVATTLQKAPVRYPGNRPNTVCFQADGIRVVLGTDTKNIVSAINLSEGE